MTYLNCCWEEDHLYLSWICSMSGFFRVFQTALSFIETFYHYSSSVDLCLSSLLQFESQTSDDFSFQWWNYLLFCQCPCAIRRLSRVVSELIWLTFGIPVPDPAATVQWLQVCVQAGVESVFWIRGPVTIHRWSCSLLSFQITMRPVDQLLCLLLHQTHVGLNLIVPEISDHLLLALSFVRIHSYVYLFYF